MIFQCVQNHDCNMLENDTIVHLFGSNVEDLSRKLQEDIDSLMAYDSPTDKF